MLIIAPVICRSTIIMVNNTAVCRHRIVGVGIKGSLQLGHVGLHDLCTQLVVHHQGRFILGGLLIGDIDDHIALGHRGYHQLAALRHGYDAVGVHAGPRRQDPIGLHITAGSPVEDTDHRIVILMEIHIDLDPGCGFHFCARHFAVVIVIRVPVNDNGVLGIIGGGQLCVIGADLLRRIQGILLVMVLTEIEPELCGGGQGEDHVDFHIPIGHDEGIMGFRIIVPNLRPGDHIPRIRLPAVPGAPVTDYDLHRIAALHRNVQSHAGAAIQSVDRTVAPRAGAYRVIGGIIGHG